MHPQERTFLATFLLEIKKTMDNLTAVGCPIATEDH